MAKRTLLPIFLAVLNVSSESVELPKVKTLRTPGGGIQPQAAVDVNGAVHLIYFKGDPKGGDIFYVRRQPGQQEFSPSIQVNSRPSTAMAIGTIRGAQLAVGKNGRVHVAWDGMGAGASLAARTAPNDHSSHPHPDDKHPLFYTRLNDAGTGFESEQNLITYAYGLDGGSSVAADLQGNVYVTWHAPLPGNTNGEAGRAVFIARSADEGKTFRRETPAISKPTGACGCCGMRAFADSRGDVFALYRTAYQMTNRDETLLISRNRGENFEIAYSHHWNVSTCPMSSAFLSESPTGVLAAAETHGRVFFLQLDPKSGTASKPISPERKAKHPVAIANTKGEILLSWTEGTGWAKGGSLAWQLYDKDLNPLGEPGRAEGVPAWSLPSAFPNPDGTFVIVY